MNRNFRMRDGSLVDLVGVGIIAIIGITIAYLATKIAPLVSLYKHPPKEVTEVRNEKDSDKKYTESLAWERKAVDGRSLFYIPPRPSDDPIKPVYTKYEGPTPYMFVNGTVYFSDGQKISAAEPDSKTLHFVRANPPWSVTVVWEKGEFEVKLFDKTSLSSLASTLSTSAWGGTGGSATAGGVVVSKPAASTQLSGQSPSDKSNQPADAKNGPGADAPPPSPPPPNGGAGGGSGGEPPAGAPPPPSDPAPAPAAPGGSGGSGSGPGGSPPSQPAPAPPSTAPSPSPSSISTK